MIKARNNNVVLIQIEEEQKGILYNPHLTSLYQVIDVGPDVENLSEKDIVILDGSYRHTTIDRQDLYIIPESKIIAVIRDAT